MACATRSTPRTADARALVVAVHPHPRLAIHAQHVAADRRPLDHDRRAGVRVARQKLIVDLAPYRAVLHHEGPLALRVLARAGEHLVDLVGVVALLPGLEQLDAGHGEAEGLLAHRLALLAVEADEVAGLAGLV